MFYIKQKVIDQNLTYITKSIYVDFIIYIYYNYGNNNFC